MKKFQLTLLGILLSFLSFAVAPITGPTSVCNGDFIILTDATPGGTWTSSSTSIAVIAGTTGTTGTVLGVAVGVAIITYTVGGPYVTYAITVNPLPSPIGGPTSLCAGTTVTRTNLAFGGVWSSSNPAVATIGASTGVVTGLTPGTATIMYTLATGCTTGSRDSVYTCIPCSGTPTGGIATGGASCTGYALQLTGASAGMGITYQWQASADNSTWSDIAGATSMPYGFSPTVTAFYRCKVTCSTSTLSAYSASFNMAYTGTHFFSSYVYSPDTACNGLHLTVFACSGSSSYSVTTYYGDATSDVTPLSSGLYSLADIFHNYSTPGTYTVKQVLNSGGVPVDSFDLYYDYHYCHTLPVKFYFDINSNCSFDTTDQLLGLPALTEVDSNGVAVDTISAISGFYYRAYGPDGTVYKFKILSVPTGMVTTCPSTGIIYDTIQTGVNYYPAKYMGINCSGIGFDLAVNGTTNCGRHMANGLIHVSNTSCTPVTSTVTMVYSPQYVFVSSTPAPTSVIGNVVTWTLSSITNTAPVNIGYYLNRLGTWLIPGDTIHTSYSVSPTSGDGDPSNNNQNRNDTVTSSFDPNSIEVNPAGYIAAGTQLTYTVHFENTGNAPAANIYVMDTLSDYLLDGSMRVIMSSAKMNVYKYRAGGHNIVKFDFPNINLLDSSHHNQCDGMFMYSIKTMPGLAYGTTIFNSAGIYFDDNEVVPTNVVENIIGTPALSTQSLNGIQNVNLFPNPATNVLGIRTDEGAFNSFVITNQVGQALLQGELTGAQKNVDIKSLAPGLYYISLKGDQGNTVRKFVKE